MYDKDKLPVNDSEHSSVIEEIKKKTNVLINK